MLLVNRLLQSLVLPLSALVLLACSGCFWGEVDGQLFFKVTATNYDQYEELLYPGERSDRWGELFEDRVLMCSDGGDDCDLASLERSDSLDLYLPYRSQRARGMITQKGDLQITSHLDVGDAYRELATDAFSDWAYMDDEDRLYGLAGDGCAADQAAADRTGVGRCVRQELLDNSASYEPLDEDLRLVITINLPGEDDIRSTRCQDYPVTFQSSDWSLPRTLRVNYNANEPEETEEGSGVYIYGEETPPLAQCDIEVYSRLQLGIEQFSADRYGADDEDGPCTIDGEPCDVERSNEAEDTLLGTVELEELVLPDEEGSPRARGRYKLRFTSDRFSARDGKVEVSGEFNVELRLDREQITEPDRNLDVESTDSETTGG